MGNFKKLSINVSNTSSILETEHFFICSVSKIEIDNHCFFERLNLKLIKFVIIILFLLKKILNFILTEIIVLSFYVLNDFIEVGVKI